MVIKNFDENDVAEYEIFIAEPDDFDLSSKAKIELDIGMIYFNNQMKLIFY